MRIQKFLPFSLLISILFVVSSLLIPVTITERAEITHVKFGYPLKFIIQDQFTGAIGLPEGPSLPYPLTVLSPWENTTQVRWIPLLANLVIVSSCVILVYRTVILIQRNDDRPDLR